MYQVVPVNRRLSTKATPGYSIDQNAIGGLLSRRENRPYDLQRKWDSKCSSSQAARNTMLFQGKDHPYEVLMRLDKRRRSASDAHLSATVVLSSNALTATWEAYPIARWITG